MTLNLEILNFELHLKFILGEEEEVETYYLFVTLKLISFVLFTKVVVFFLLLFLFLLPFFLPPSLRANFEYWSIL